MSSVLCGRNGKCCDVRLCLTSLRGSNRSVRHIYPSFELNPFFEMTQMEHEEILPHTPSSFLVSSSSAGVSVVSTAEAENSISHPDRG